MKKLSLYLAVPILILVCVGCGDGDTVVEVPPADVSKSVEQSAPEKTEVATNPSGVAGQDDETESAESEPAEPDDPVIATEPETVPSPPKEPWQPGTPIQVESQFVVSSEGICQLVPRPQIKLHPSGIQDVAFSPDGRWVATGERDLLIRITDAKTGEVIQELHFKEETSKFAGLECLAFSKDGGLFAVAAEDRIKFWTVADWMPAGELEVDCKYFRFANSGKLILISDSHPPHIQVWDVVTGKKEKDFETNSLLVDRFAMTPDGKQIAVDGKENVVDIFEVATGEKVKSISGFERTVSAVAMAPDGKLLAAAAGDQLMVWNLETEEAVFRSEGPRSLLAFSADGRLLLEGFYEVVLRQVDKDFAKLASFRISGSSAAIAGEISPLGTQVIASDIGEQQRADYFTLEWTRQLSSINREELAADPDGEFKAKMATASPDGRYLVTSDGTQVLIWTLDQETGKGKLKHKIASPFVGVVSLDFSRDSKQLLLCGKTGIALVDPDSGKPVKLFDNATLTPNGESTFNAAKFTPQGNLLVHDYYLMHWDVEQQEKIEPRLSRDPYRLMATFSDDGKLLANVSSKLEILSWPEAEVQASWQPHSGNQFQMAFSPDGKQFATCNDTDAVVKIWEPETGALLHELTPECLTKRRGATAVAISKDGKWVLAAGNDGWLHLWSLPQGKLRAAFPSGHEEEVEQLQFVAGNRFISRGKNGLVNYWDLSKLLAELPVPAEPETADDKVTPMPAAPWLSLGGEANEFASITADGKRLLAGDNRTISLHDLETGEVLAEQHVNDCNDVAISPDGKWIATAHGDAFTAFRHANRRKGWVEIRDEGLNLVRKITMEQPVANLVAFSPTGTLAVATQSTGFSHTSRITFWDVAKGEQTAKFLPDYGKFSAMVYSPDGSQLATARKNTVAVWRLDTNKRIKEFECSLVNDLKYSADGSLLLAGVGDNQRGHIQVWNLKDGSEPPFLKDFTEQVNAIDLSPDGKFFVAGCRDGDNEWTCKVWEFPSGKLLRCFEPEGLSPIEFLPDQSRFVTAGTNFYSEELAIWDLDTLLDLDFAKLLDKLTQRGKVKSVEGNHGVAVLNVASSILDEDLVNLPEISQPFGLNLEYAENLSAEALAAIKDQRNLRVLRLPAERFFELDEAALTAVAAMKQLEELDVSNLKAGQLNRLSGLTELRRLNLSGTDVTADDLKTLASFAKLKWLSLGDLQVAGGLEPLSQLQALRVLNLNYATVAAGDFQHLKALPNLREISLENVDLPSQGLEELATCPSLRKLSLAFADVEDADMKQLAPLKQLTELKLGWTELTAEGLRPVGQLTNLEWLDLPDEVTDEGLAHLAGLTKLKLLGVSGEAISDAGLKKLDQLNNLNAVFLGNCPNVKGEGLAAFAGATGLDRLDLRETGVTDDGLAEVAKLPQLEYLQLPTPITDAGVAKLAALPNLKTLDLEATQVTDAVIETLAKFPKLETLFVEDTKMTKTAVQVFERSHGVQIFGVHSLSEKVEDQIQE